MLTPISKELKDSIKSDTLFVEEQLSDGSFQIVYLPLSYEDGVTFLRSAKMDNYLALWSQDWAGTELGFAPMAWVNTPPKLD